MPKPTPPSPFEALEREAYHAYREWHLFLMLRLHALAQHLPATPKLPNPQEPHDEPATV